MLMFLHNKLILLEFIIQFYILKVLYILYHYYITKYLNYFFLIYQLYLYIYCLYNNLLIIINMDLLNFHFQLSISKYLSIIHYLSIHLFKLLYCILYLLYIIMSINHMFNLYTYKKKFICMLHLLNIKSYSYYLFIVLLI